MPLRRVRENTGGLLHEIVHIYAPHNNRFLAEGLAVYLHATLADNPAFPNFGEDLRRLAVRSLSEVESLDALNRVRTPRPLGTVMDERTVYVLAGSFVGFLIERYAVTRFRRVYETEDYDTVYGKSFGALEREWRASLQPQSLGYPTSPRIFVCRAPSTSIMASTERAPAWKIAVALSAIHSNPIAFRSTARATMRSCSA